MVYIYTVIILLALLLIAICRRRSKNIISRLDKKEHPLKVLYGLAIIIANFLQKIKGNRYEKLKNNLRCIYVQENVEREFYWFQVKRIAAAIGIGLVFCLFGLMVSLSEYTQAGNNINYLSRADPGEGNLDYSLTLEGEKDSLNISLEERKLTKEEIHELFAESYEGIIKALLKENPDQNNVAYDLNFIDKYSLIELNWTIPEESKDLINYMGEITANFSKQSSIVATLQLTMKYDDLEEVFEVPLCLVEREKTDAMRIEEELQEIVNSEDNIYSNQVALPKEISGKEVSFFKLVEEQGAYFLLLGAAATGLIIFLYEKNLNKQVKEREEELIRAYPDFVSKLALFNEAGLNLLSAWRRIIADGEKANKGDKYLYREMKLTYNRIKNGEAEGKEYLKFGKRCGLQQYLKLGNILEQNLMKGNAGLSNYLRQESRDARRERRRGVRKKGEEASTKLVFPMILNLGIIIAIVIIPAINTMNF